MAGQGPEKRPPMDPSIAALHLAVDIAESLSHPEAITDRTAFQELTQMHTRAQRLLADAGYADASTTQLIASSDRFAHTIIASPSFTQTLAALGDSDHGRRLQQLQTHATVEHPLTDPSTDTPELPANYAALLRGLGRLQEVLADSQMRPYIEAVLDRILANPTDDAFRKLEDAIFIGDDRLRHEFERKAREKSQ